MIFHVKIGVEASNEEHALDIAKDLVELKNLLPDNDIKDLIKVIKENPGVVKTAKTFLRKK